MAKKTKTRKYARRAVKAGTEATETKVTTVPPKPTGRPRKEHQLSGQIMLTTAAGGVIHRHVSSQLAQVILSACDSGDLQ